MHICIYIYISLCCTPKINTTLQINYTSLKKKVVNRQKEEGSANQNPQAKCDLFPVSVNKILFAPRHACLFMYCLYLLLCETELMVAIKII